MTNYKSGGEEEFNFSRNDKRRSINLPEDQKLKFFRVFNLILKIQKNVRNLLNKKYAINAVIEVIKSYMVKFLYLIEK